MRKIKLKKIGGQILAILLCCCMIVGFVIRVNASPDGTNEVGGGIFLNKWIEETEDGNFKLTLESYATGTNGTVTMEPVPLDIVLVLDESGSMADTLVYGCDNTEGTDINVTAQGHLLDNNTHIQGNDLMQVLFVGHKVLGGKNGTIDTDKVYTVVYPEADSIGSATREIYYCEECDGWFSVADHSTHANLAEWIPFTSEAQTPSGGKIDGDWYYNVQFYERCGKTGKDVLQEALADFLGTLYTESNSSDGEPIDNRVAIVGYGQGASYIGTDGSRTKVYADPGDTAGGTPVDGADSLAANAWYNVNDITPDTINTWVDGINANGSTHTHLGIQAAELAFDNLPETKDEKRAKVMLLFMDGAPGANYNNYGPGQNQYPNWVTPGIESAKKMKDNGVTIYSVGLFPEANGFNALDIDYDVTANGNGHPVDKFFTNANCFLHLISSNYPEATDIASEYRGSLSSEYIEGTNSFYLGAQDAKELEEILHLLSETLTPGATTVTLDETAYVMDEITDYFDIIDENGMPSITAWTESYIGNDSNGGMQWKKDDYSVSTPSDIGNEDKLHITIDGKNVEVSNFDFAGNYVHMNGNVGAGKKLVIEILITPSDTNSGGVMTPTNGEESGIYGEGDVGPIIEFPVPHVDLPTTVTIKKVVEGSKSTEAFSFEATYTVAENYENVPSEGNSDGNHLEFTGGTSKTDKFTLMNGDSYTLQNIKVGSSITISEDATKGWAPTVTTSNGTKVVQPDTDGKYTIEVTPGMIITFTNVMETVDIKGSKSWDDANNQDGKRPDSITIRLYANGEMVDNKTVGAEDDWKWVFKNLPKYANGEKIIYTITEDTVPNYTTSYDGYNVKNSYKPGKTNINVIKNWQDNNNHDNVRPDNITIKLLADGIDTGKTLVLDDSNNWMGTFSNLDEYQDGKKITYTVQEESVKGYESVITGDASTGFTITNRYTSETVSISGTKTWDDANNQDGKRPDSITIRLYANGTEVDSMAVTAEDNWEWSFDNLLKYAKGEEITYTISEDAVPDYTTIYNGYNITNSYTPGKTSVTVTKSWQDNNNRNNTRPDTITVKLLANGDDTSETLILDDSNNWMGTFSNLDEYQDGKKITYTIEEVLVKDYESVITGDDSTGFIITNVYTPPKASTDNDSNSNTNSEIPNDDVPDTGDTMNLLFWIIIMAISGIGFIVMLFFRRNNQYPRKY